MTLTLNDPRQPNNYRSAERLLNGRDSRKIANNTTLRRDGDEFVVRLHYTDIVRYHADDTVTLNSGGWQTVTTKQRMNLLTNLRVYQRDYTWYVVEAGASWDDAMEYGDRDRYSN